MKNSITIQSILQSVLSQDEVNLVVKQMGYEDKARKFSVYHLLQYWSQSAFEQWDSYRSGVDHASRIKRVADRSLFLFLDQSRRGPVCCFQGIISSSCSQMQSKDAL
ncbi:hypothetical protein M3650_15260 [Paenibacillus sp. MER TA 81-3]|uniref:hypothetical protein n=1 Tax=Paenibacillus sp. MER TA 81-3 TaxID=2939573 RepID=UPI00203C75FF|nr:hypothetical protein [Paenibacillus sp. MER TA 81-3]MCM3339953.1 hypothetical protein [Paenibacillus sp. MER TA 81-3]